MPIFDTLARFYHDEEGAVAIDWVVLTSACFGLGMAVITALSDATETTSRGVPEQGEETDTSGGPASASGRTATPVGG